MIVPFKYILYIMTALFLGLSSFETSTACCGNDKKDEEESTFLIKESKKIYNSQTVISNQPKSYTDPSKIRTVSISLNSSTTPALAKTSSFNFIDDTFDSSISNTWRTYFYWYPKPFYN